MPRHEALRGTRATLCPLPGRDGAGAGVACRWLPCWGQKDEREGCRVGSDLEALVVISKVWWLLGWLFCLFFFKEPIAFFAILY